MKEVWQRRVLLIAAAWNLVGGISALLDPSKHFGQLFTASLDLSDPLQLFFFRCVWINVIAWGVAYFLAAFWAPSRKAILAAGAPGLRGRVLRALRGRRRHEWALGRRRRRQSARDLLRRSVPSAEGPARVRGRGGHKWVMSLSSRSPSWRYSGRLSSAGARSREFEA